MQKHEWHQEPVPVDRAQRSFASTERPGMPTADGLLDALELDAELRTYSRSTLTLLSYAIEEPFEHQEAYGTLLAGFQRVSRFLPQLERYRAIARTADAVHIWALADVPVPDDLPPNLMLHRLATDHPLLATWFVIACGPSFHSALLAQELPRETGGRRRFSGGWTTTRRSVVEAIAWLARTTGASDLLTVMPPVEPAISQLQDRLVARTRRRVFEQLEASAARHQQETAATEERYQQERALRSEGDRLRELQQLLADTTVHDIRNAQAITIGCLEILLNDDGASLTVAQRQLASMALAGGLKVTALAQTVLDVARFEAGAFTISATRLSVLDVEVLIDEVAAPRRLLGQAIDTSIDDQLPPFTADTDLLERVLGNLLDNAARYARGSRTVVSVTGDEHAVCWRVRDFGPGVPRGARHRIFETFGRAADGSGPRGTGLGLAFCRLVAEAHGGTIQLESPEDGGACFVLTLPVEPQHARPAGHRESSA